MSSDGRCNCQGSISSRSSGHGVSRSNGSSNCSVVVEAVVTSCIQEVVRVIIVAAVHTSDNRNNYAQHIVNKTRHRIICMCKCEDINQFRTHTSSVL
jgi:hypothetical protein